MKQALYTLIRNGKHGIGSTVLKGLLWVLSWIYWFLIKLRLLLFSAKILPSTKLSEPVIGVGNITTGGVGKTPFVAMLARYLLDRQKKPAILLRGYMSKAGSKSDEAQWYERTLRGIAIIVGEDRANEAKRFLSGATCDIFLMDDGFQHLGLARDLDIVLIDATDPWGGGFLIPRGFLREPVSSLRRADVIAITKTDQAKGALVAITQKILRVNPKALIVHSVHEPELFYDPTDNQTHPLEIIHQKRIVVLCSIGAPRSFNTILQQLKASILESYHFMDHHLYTATDIQSVVDTAARQGAQYIVTTEKDLVKLQEFFPRFTPPAKLLALRIHLQLTKNKDEFLKRVDHLL